MNVSLIFPAALLPSYTLASPSGAPLTLTPTNGLVTVDARLTEALLSVGFTPAPGVGTTPNRPTAGLYAGEYFFDSTLGKSIWRNAANSGWVDATGTAV
jgi:hypothetical protein